jgi:hypothetical protein
MLVKYAAESTGFLLKFFSNTACTFFLYFNGFGIGKKKSSELLADNFPG